MKMQDQAQLHGAIAEALLYSNMKQIMTMQPKYVRPSAARKLIQLFMCF